MAIVAFGCGGKDGTSATTVTGAGGLSRLSDASLPANAGVPVPAEATVLTIKGNVGAGNVGEDVAFDLPTLEKLGLMSVTTYEPFEKRDIQFTGVRLADVLAAADAPAAATSVHLTALDDYQVDLRVNEVRQGGVLLATLQDGRPIPVEAGGPIRVVFGKGVAAGENPDQWIWSVSTMSVT
jgi:hypothetical protein